MNRLKLLKELLENRKKTYSRNYHFRRGVSEYAKGEYGGAVTEFLKAMGAGGRDDGIVAACIYCAISYYRGREYGKAVEYLQKYLEHAPDGRHSADVRRLILDLEI